MWPDKSPIALCWKNLYLSSYVWHHSVSFITNTAVVFGNMSPSIMSGEAGEKKFWTPPFDPRFPNTNQTRNCWQNYIDFHRCQKVKGEDYSPCEYFKRVYTSLCPVEWVEKWDEQRSEGRFPGRI